MKWFKRSWLSITRNKIKPGILFLTTFIIGSFLSSTLALYLSNEQIIAEIKNKLGPVATVHSYYNFDEPYADTYDKYFDEYTMILEKLAQDPAVEYANIHYSLTGFASPSVYDDSIMSYQDYEATNKKAVSLTCYRTNYPIPIEVQEYKMEITDGRGFTEEEINTGANVILLPENYKRNDNQAIQIGDQIQLYYKKDQQIILEYQVKVIGKFKQINQLPQDMNLSDCVIMPNQTIEHISLSLNEAWLSFSDAISHGDHYDIPQISISSPIIRLKNIDYLEAFHERAALLLKNKNYVFSSASDIYDAIAGIIENMSFMSKFLVSSAFISSILILSLITTMFIRLRKHEIGVYMAVGEKKNRIIFQFIHEILFIMLLSFNLSLLAGKQISNSLSEELMNFLIDPNIQTITQTDELLNPEQISRDTILNNYSLSFDSSFLIVYEVLSLSVFTLSASFPLIYLVKSKPKDILSE